MTTVRELPDALTGDAFVTALGGRRAGVFLDYDGVLTPIVDDPAAARLDDATRQAVARLAEATTVAVVSGRDLEDVRTLVDLPELAYAGSHGFDLLLPDGRRERRGEEFLDSLDAAGQALRDELADVQGVQVERKRYAIAVHERRVADKDRDAVAGAVRAVADRHDDLRLTGGKRIQELRPDVDWHKGRALAYLIDVLDLAALTPVYLGDDLTDEDAFAELQGRGGLGVVVAAEAEEDRSTLARYRLDDPDAARALLGRLADQLA